MSDVIKSFLGVEVNKRSMPIQRFHFYKSDSETITNGIKRDKSNILKNRMLWKTMLECKEQTFTNCESGTYRIIKKIDKIKTTITGCISENSFQKLLELIIDEKN